MNDFLVSLIRTWVPVGVGLVIAWVVRNTGLGIDEDTSAQVTAVAVSVATALYYLVVRTLETRWPAFGWLLGVKRAPSYPTGE